MVKNSLDFLSFEHDKIRPTLGSNFVLKYHFMFLLIVMSTVNIGSSSSSSQDQSVRPHVAATRQLIDISFITCTPYLGAVASNMTIAYQASIPNVSTTSQTAVHSIASTARHRIGDESQLSKEAGIASAV